ncbi:MAG: 4Fe-4S dicluster domain-containing protein [bacterium]|nr:4Fe-4S dicluster domain-containing protein [bacterium]
MDNNIYREIQKKLDTYSVGFPETESGVEINILKKLFNREDAEMFLALSPLLETPDSVAGRLNLPLEKVSAQLENMAQQGLLFRLKKEGSVKYGAIPFIHGLFEFRVGRIDADIAKLLEQYYEEGLRDSIAKSAGNFLRTVPIMKSLTHEIHVSAFDDACEILKKMNTIIVTDCVCAEQRGLIADACPNPKEVCFMFGSMAQYYIDNNMGRQVDADEAIAIVKKAQEAGLVTQPATSQNPSGMCNCCGDCCAVLASTKIHPKPAELVFSNHFAVVDPDCCISCENCLDPCPMDAISMNDDAIAAINYDRCIGCGVCVLSCSSDAISLSLKPEEKRRVPPKNSAEQMMNMAKDRGLLK